MTRREFLGLSLLFGCNEEDMNITKKWWLLTGSGPAAWSPTDLGNSLVYFLDPANTTTMFKENATNSTPITAVAADADTIGLIYDRGYHGFYATAESDATRPTLGSDGTTVNSCVVFNNAASSRFRVINSQSYLRKFSEAAGTWCIATRVKMGASTNGNTYYLLMSQANSTANFGLRLLRFTDNKWNLWIVYGSAGNQRCLISFDQTQVEADGWVDLIIYANGASGTAIIGNTSQNFTLTSGATGNATNDLRIGSAHDGTSPFKGSMAYLAILNRIPTADEITKLKAYNPARNTANWCVNDAMSYNYNDTTKGWADTGKTVAITNGTAYRAWEPKNATIFGPLNRDLTTASAGVSAIFTTNEQNSKAGLVHDGVDDNGGFASSFFRERGGSGVLLMVVKNTRALLGSHFLFGSAYVVGTGSQYPSGDLGLGETYFTVHPVAGSGIGATAFKNKVEATNVIVFRRVGSAWSAWSGDKVKHTATDANLFIATSMGAAAIVGWELQGTVFKIDYHVGTKTDAEIEALIDAENTSYNI
jgi:hypothetical protein